MKKKRIKSSFCLFLCFSLYGCTSQDTSIEEINALSRPVSVSVMEAKEGILTDNQTLIGEISAESKGKVFPQVGGTIVKLYKKKGESVKRGEIIGEIDNSEQVLALRQAQSKLDEAKARLAQARSTQTVDTGISSSALAKQSLESARKSYERIKKLVQEGALPAAQLDTAEADWLRAQNAFRAATISDAKDETGITIISSGVSEAMIALEKAENALQNTKITAPIDGVINQLSVVVGDTVNLQTSIAEIIDLDSVIVNTQVPEKDLPQFREGEKIEVYIPALQRKTEGLVLFTGFSASPETKLFPIEIRLANPDQALRLGMRADVKGNGREGTLGVLLPLESIVDEDDKTCVYVVKGATAYKREVEVLEGNTSEVLIRDGVVAGEQIVVRGQSDLFDQVSVKIN